MTIHIHYGPRLEARPTEIQRSASWCRRCRRYRVQTLTAMVPIEPSYYGPHYVWSCPCGGSKSAPEYGE